MTAVKLSSLRLAARQLKAHARSADSNKDKLLTTAEVRRYGAKQGDGFKVGGALLTMHSWALRDLERASSAAVTHLQQRVDQSMQLLLGKDLDRDGKLEDGKELNSVKRLKTFQALATLAGEPLPGSSKLTGAALEVALNRAGGKATYISEGDFSPEGFNVELPAGHALTANNAVAALRDTLAGFYDEQSGDLSGYAFERFSAKNAKSFIDGLSEVNDPDDSSEVANAAAWKKVTDLLKANLTELQVIKHGPGTNGTLASDQGTYAFVIAGKTADGRVGGVLFGSVET